MKTNIILNSKFNISIIISFLNLVILFSGGFNIPNTIFFLLINIFLFVDYIPKLSKYIFIKPIAILLMLALFLVSLKSNAFSIFNSYNFLYVISILTLVPFFSKNEKMIPHIKEHIGFYIFFSINLISILFNFNTIEPTDNSRHAYNCLNIFDLLTSNEKNKIASILFYYDFYPNLYYISTIPFMMLFGKSIFALTATNLLLWLPIGYYYFRKTATEFYKIEGIKLSAIFLIAFGGSYLHLMLNSTMLDFPTFCLTPVLIYYFFKSNFFKDSRYSMFLGVSIGLGIITKSTFIIIGASMYLLSFIYILLEFKRNKFNAEQYNIMIFLENISKSVICIFFSGGWWYLINYSHYSFEYPNVTTLAGQVEGDPEVMSLDSFTYYIKGLWGYFETVPFLINLTLVGFALYMIFIKKVKTHFDIKLSPIFIYIIFYLASTSVWNKDYRTFLPSVILLFPLYAMIGKINDKIANIISIICIVSFTTTSVLTLKNNTKQTILFDNKVTYSHNLLPEYIDLKEAHYVFKNMINDHLDTTFTPELKGDIKLSMYTDLLYSKLEIYPKKSINFKLGKFNKYIYLKDYYTNNYLMIGIKKLSDTTYLAKTIGENFIHGGGDISSNSTYIDSTGKWNAQNHGKHADSTVFRFPRNSSDKKVNFGIVHSLPKNQLLGVLYSIINPNAPFSFSYFRVLNKDLNSNDDNYYKID